MDTTVKITNTPETLGIKPGSQTDSRNRATRASGAAESGTSGSSAQVSTRQVTAGETPFNAEQVERIKTAIRNGEFQVNAQAVADRLLQIEGDLLR